LIEIRPLQQGDLPQVAGLLELVYRSGTRTPSPGFVRYLGRLFLAHPWVDHEIPSLVAIGTDGRVLGFLGSHVRRFQLDDKPIRVSVGGQLATDPEHRGGPVGLSLMQHHLHGVQEISVTDSASEPVRLMWERLGGETSHLGHIGWLRIFRPMAFATRFGLARRPSAAMRTIGALSGPVDHLTTWVARAQFGTTAPEVQAEPLTPRLLLEHLPAVTHGLRLRPDYDEPFLRWLFQELTEVRIRGRPVAQLVRDRRQRVLGWYIYYLQPGGISQVLQVAGAERNLPSVLDHLFHHARTKGAAALQGRMEPALIEPLSMRHCVVHISGFRVLLHSRSVQALDAINTGRALFSRLDGDWWIRLRGAG
jgi:hypothetical protein